MKNLLIFTFLFLGTLAYGQNMKFNLIVSGDYTKPTYSYSGGGIVSQIEEQLPMGLLIAAQTEFSLGEKMAFYTGLTYNQKHFYPRLALGGFYGGLIDPTGTLDEFSYPYLKEHRFHLLSVPIGLKFTPWKHQKIQPYFSFGFESSFRFAESEIYQDQYAGQEGFPPIQDDLVIDDNAFAYFGTTFNFGIGVNFKISDRWAILMHHQMGLWEFRAANEKFKKNDTFLFNKTFLTMSQLSLGIGIQKSF